MAFCGKCGAQLPDNVKFCDKCGAPTAPGAAQGYAGTNTGYGAHPAQQRVMLENLSSRIQVSAIIWIIIGALQILGMVTVLLGAYNIYVGIQNLNYSKKILTYPVGIVAGQESLTMPIVMLVLNLVLGGVIGVVGSIYDILGIRGYVMQNKAAFLNLEQQAINGNF